MQKDEIMKFLDTAMKSGKFFIAMSYVSAPDQLEHGRWTCSFPRGDIMPSLDEHARHLEKEVNLPVEEVKKEIKIEKPVKDSSVVDGEIVNEEDEEKPVAGI